MTKKPKIIECPRDAWQGLPGTIPAEVKADYALGQRIGIEHTPTIWVVTNRTGNAAPFVEVVDRTKLYNIIDEALAETKPATHTTTASAKH